ncbi:hypothetical protein KIN20_031219 [Parelaphostrongylus tenuis]|uniref:separase n=1 Tax=Parelaphostrongylus tenuis TaxID=148309 RepID=A0AAD5R523_PARTN|nr:hypothetical protein KIN20_031219 [Parelaphostrongylus tenuis]
MCSHIPKVAANFSLDDVEPIDSFNCLHRAVVKSESVMKNRIIGIQKEAEPLDFMKVSSDACDFLKACASFAESCELRREFSIELLNVGMVHDAAFHSQLGLWCAMKLGVLFRIQQFVNLNTLIRQCVVQIEFKNDLQYCLDIMRTMYLKKFMSKSGSGCFLKEKDDNLFGSSNDLDLPLPYTPTSTPHFPSTSVGQKSVASSIMESFEDLRLEQTKISSCRSNTIASKLIDSFQELTLTDATCSLHELSARCDCKTCGLCKTKLQCCFRILVFVVPLCLDVRLFNSKPHATISQVTISCGRRAMCCSGQKSETASSFVNVRNVCYVCSTVKICSYSSIRTISYRLAISQLERVQNIRRSPRYQWMADDSRTNKIMNTMKQYIFPSRLCRNVDAKDLDDSIDSVEQNGVEKAIVDGALSEYTLHSDLLYRDWRFPLCTFLGEHVTCPWLAAMMWSESTLLATRQLSRHLSGQLKGLTFSEPSIFQEMVVNLPEDFTLIHLALSHDGSLHLIKMHKDREPIIMPLAPKSKVENVKAMMEKIIDENTRTCNLGKTTKDAKAFWAARRAVDADLKNLIPRVQDILLGAAAPLLLPSISITRKGITVAKCLVAASQCSNGAQLPLSFAKELVSLATKIERTEWIFVVERMCDVLGISSRKENIQDLYLKTRTSALNIGLSDNSPSYTFLIVCPDLTTIPWEVVPILDGATYVARVPSVHAFFQALSSSKQVPIAVNIQKAFYVLDPDNNLGETQKRIKNYVSKFGWQGIVGKIPSTAEVTEALRQQDVFFYMGHGSGSRYFGRRAISESTINAVSVLMGCGSVRLTTLGWGMDGKSSVYDYSVARCPSVVGCLWTVTDGEIDRYFMALVDLCFSSDANRTLTGAEGGDTRLRLLVEAMKKAKGRCKLPYLTGAAVVSYGIPVVASE